ncbi:hypothetical protein M011DRAFT_526457 [Sporormia fimetaria CBS 119925]|uniref:Uncharacterized protein n=1 Tax=Sporormia fimetaria CBS 119925 TaxID=1340428 RepID=A0A6A6VAG0_9PLEO|nr:hypothetical protein M011DRAFT_526457 [Sporormia fimetaria CBS 119925]
MTGRGVNPYWYKFPGFTPNPNVGISTEFRRLAKFMGWEGYKRDEEKIEAYGSEIEFHWGRDDHNKLTGLKDICNELGVAGNLTTITQMVKALKAHHINVVNLINHRRNPNLPIIRFPTRKAFVKYTGKPGNTCPKEAAKRVAWVKVLLEVLER